MLGARDQSQASENFIELLRARADRREGKKGAIILTVIDDQVEVRVGGKVMIRAEFDGLGDATEVGLFSRGEGETAFDNFKASGRVRVKGGGRRRRIYSPRRERVTGFTGRWPRRERCGWRARLRS